MILIRYGINLHPTPQLDTTLRGVAQLAPLEPAVPFILRYA
jgi:hypothetical protein